MLENLLFCDDGISGFVDKLRNGRFDKEQGEKSISAINELLVQVKKSDIKNSDVADLCSLMYHLHSYAEEFEEVRSIEQKILDLIDDLY